MESGGGWGQLDRMLAARLVQAGVAASRLEELHADARRRGEERSGSCLAAAIVRLGLMPPQLVDEHLRQAAASARPASGTFPVAGPTTASGRYPAAPGSGVFPAKGPSTASGRYPAPPSGRFPAAAPPPSGPFATPSSGRFAASSSSADARTMAGPLTPPPGSSSSSGRTLGMSTGRRPPSQRLVSIVTVFAGARFDVISEAGPGKWVATDRRMKRPVLLHVGPPVEAPEAAAFLREARLLGAIAHPCVPEVHEAGDEKGRVFYTTDRIEGTTLDDATSGKTGAAPALSALLRAFLDVAAGVARAHDVGVVHGALSPRAITIGSYGRTWITGWDGAGALPGAPAAVREAAALPGARRDAGTIVAPEVAQGAAPGERSDVFGLGTVLDAMLDTSDRPPAPLVAIARKATALDPDARYERAEDVLEDVRRFLDGKRVTADDEGLFGAALRVARRFPAAAAVVLVFSVLVLALAAIGTRQVLSLRDEARASEEAASKAEERKRSSEGATAASRKSIEGAHAIARGLVEVDELLASARQRVLRRDARLDDEAAKLLDDAREAGVALDVPARMLAERLRRSASPEDRAVATILEDEVAAARTTADFARGEFWIAGANVRRPAVALEAFEAGVRRGGVDPERIASANARIVQVARRLMGQDEKRKEAARALQRTGGPLAPVAELLELSDALGSETRANHEDPRKEERVNAGRALAATRPDVPLASEVLGRLGLTFWENGPSFEGWSRLELVDPGDPFGHAMFMKTLYRANNLFPVWRWNNGHQVEQVVNALRAEGAPDDFVDPEPALFVIDYLQKLERYAATLPLATRLVNRLEAARKANIARPGDLERARILLARAELAAGKDPSCDVRALSVPEELEADRVILGIWAGVATRAPAEDVVERVKELFRTRARPTQAGFPGLRDAFLEPRADPATMVAVADSFLGPRGARPRDVVQALLVLARTRALATRGEPPIDDVGTAAQIVGGTFFESGDQLRVVLFAQLAPIGHPGALVDLTRIASGANAGFSATEWVAYEARDALVDRLSRLGRERAAGAFAALDPVEETWVPPEWMPPETVPWRRR